MREESKQPSHEKLIKATELIGERVMPAIREKLEVGVYS